MSVSARGGRGARIHSSEGANGGAINSDKHPGRGRPDIAVGRRRWGSSRGEIKTRIRGSGSGGRGLSSDDIDAPRDISDISSSHVFEVIAVEVRVGAKDNIHTVDGMGIAPDVGDF